MAPGLETCKACVHLACGNLRYDFDTYTSEPSRVKVFSGSMEEFKLLKIR